MKEVAFISLATENMKSVLEVMRKEIAKESERGNKIFFDITGGESMILVAFGMLSKEFHTPMHMYNVEKNELIDINCEVKESISTCAPKQDMKYNLNHYISMRGGCITNKEQTHLQCEADVYAMWEVANKYWYYWNSLSEFMRAYMIQGEDLVVRANVLTIEKALKNTQRTLKTTKKLNEILTALSSKGILRDFECKNGKYYYRFKNTEVKNWMWKSRTILELYVHLQKKKKNDDSRVSVHLDWDGVVHNELGMDPWKMLEKVMTDEEYNDYISELERDGRFLFKVFYDQPVVKLDQDMQCDADILYALVLSVPAMPCVKRA